MKIVTMLGARLQFIKAEMVSREIAKYDANMFDIFFEQMQISKPCITLRDETEWIERVEHNKGINPC
jgi:UDP-N-acetylglucosamine 2-epimerase